MAENLAILLGLFFGTALGQFSVVPGWVALGLAAVAGHRRASWFSIQIIGVLGGLAASFIFKGTAVDLKWGGLPGNVLFNTLVYMLIACAGYAVGWLVMRVLRKGADE